MTGSWVHRVIEADDRESWSEHAGASFLYANDGIATAAGLAEGFATGGASTGTLFLVGAAVIVAGGVAASGTRYAEKRIEWELNHRRLEGERASIAADPQAEFEELVGIYETKGLSENLARQVAAALTEHDPVAAHADAELGLDSVELHLDTTESPLISRRAALTAGFSYALGAFVPLAVVIASPRSLRIELTIVAVLAALVLTAWLTSRLTGLPALRLVRRNLLLGATTLAAGIVIGLISGD